MPKALKAALQHFSKPVRNERGVALMIAIACMMLITFIAMEVIYDSRVEYEVNSQSLNRLKAYYAAKSGMQLSLLRIKIYQQAQQKFGDKLGSNSALLDQVWKFPMAWPLPIPDEVSAVDKDAFKKLQTESTMDSSYITTIEDEGSKIDLNDLNSPSKQLQELTKKQLLTVFLQKKNEDEKFAREYGNIRFEEVVNNIADWMTSKSASLNGGDKRAAYGELNSESQSDYYPPNRPFRTIAELHMVAGMTDAFYDLLAPRVTIYGMKGINPNLATREVLKSLDPAMTSEVVDEIVKRRDSQDLGGPFQNAEDFWGFVQQKGVRIEANPDDVPLIFDSIMNFRIRSSGVFGAASREITAVVVDINRTVDIVKKYMDKENQDPNAPPDSSKPPPATKKEPLPKGPPRVVFWSEK